MLEESTLLNALSGVPCFMPFTFDLRDRILFFAFGGVCMNDVDVIAICLCMILTCWMDIAAERCPLFSPFVFGRVRPCWLC